MREREGEGEGVGERAEGRERVWQAESGESRVMPVKRSFRNIALPLAHRPWQGGGKVPASHGHLRHPPPNLDVVSG